MKWLARLFEPLATYSPLQRRGFWLLLPAVVLILAVSQLWRAYEARQIEVDTSDYLALRQWVVALQDSLAARPAALGAKELISIAKLPKEDLNTATALELQRVQGIGRVLSRRIVLYREALGGFYSLAQLDEIKKLSKKVQDRIRQRYVLEADVAPLCVNRLSQEELSIHPYLSSEVVEKIVKGRPFLDTLGFRTKVLMPEGRFSRLRPYLSFVP